MSVYASILPRLSNKWIFKYNKDLNLLGFPSILQKRGFETIYVHGANIGYSDKQQRIDEWFETQIDLKNFELKQYLDNIDNLKQTSLGKAGTVEPILKYIKDI
jgi:hypothetical protein